MSPCFNIYHRYTSVDQAKIDINTVDDLKSVAHHIIPTIVPGSELVLKKLDKISISFVNNNILNINKLVEKEIEKTDFDTFEKLLCRKY